MKGIFGFTTVSKYRDFLNRQITKYTKEKEGSEALSKDSSASSYLRWAMRIDANRTSEVIHILETEMETLNGKKDYAIVRIKNIDARAIKNRTSAYEQCE